MTSSDQPLSNSPKCEMCGGEIDEAWPVGHPPVQYHNGEYGIPHQVKPAPLSNSPKEAARDD